MATRKELGLQWNAFVCLLSTLLVAGVRSQTDFEISFSSHPMSQVVRSGVQVTLSCTVQSSLPPLTFRWYHDNSEVTFVQSKFAISNAPQTSTLLINSVSTSDVGQYWCVSEFTDLGSVRSLSAALSLADIDSIEGASSGTMTVRVFDQVVLRCPPPASTPPAVISWLKENVAIAPTSDGRVGITLDGDLVISGVQVEDTGRHYICQATNLVAEVTERSSTSVLLQHNNANQRNSYEPQQFVVQPAGIQEVVLGGRARIQCFTTAGPPSTISWYKDGSLVSPGNPPGITLEQGNRVLSLSDVGVEDAGMYWCQAEQMGFDGTAVNSTTEELVVLVPPSITVGPGNRTALAGASKTLSCEASGSTPLQWNWLHDGEPIESDAHFIVSNNQLQINNIDQSSDSGVYQCVAQHLRAGSAMSAGVLNVQVSGPVITNVTDTDVVAFVGDTVQLKCLASGSPVPTYRWLKNDAAISDTRFSLNGGDLMLTSSVTSDTGQYVCEAFSAAGMARSRAVIVEIIEPLTVERSPQSSKQVELGSTSTLSCKLRVANTQSVTYEWTMNGAIVDTTSLGSRFMLTSGSGDLTITSAVTSDSGLYICYGLIALVGKMADSVRQKVGESTVVVATTPGQPGNITVGSISARSLRLSWTSPSEDGGRDIMGYVIEVRVISPFGNENVAGFNSNWQQWNQSDLPTPMTSYEVTGLYPYTSYQFRVMAKNSVGQGRASEPSETRTTSQDVPDAPPQSVDARKSGEAGSVNITWQPPSIRLPDGRGRNGVITGYTVSYGLNGQGSTMEQEVGPDMDSLLVEQLNLNSFYVFRVRARTTAGAGSYSDGVTESTDAFDPEKLMNITTELISNVSSSRGGVVKVTWDPPTIPEEYSSVVRVLSYVVTVVFSDASEEVLQEVTVAANVTWAVIPQLDWGRRYSFIIRVNFSSFSNLGPPALGRVALPQGPPSPILTVNSTVGLDSTLVLVWKLPNDGGSPIVRVVVEAFSQDAGWSIVANLSSSATAHSIFSVYDTGFSHFRVVACNSIGCSWGSNQSAVALPDPTTTEPFYKTIWFIAVVAVVGLILIVCVLIATIAVCSRCCLRFRKGTYTMSSERASSIGSMLSVRNRPMYTLSYGQNHSVVGSDSPFVNSLSQTGHVLSGSISRLDAHLEFGPPGEPTYGGSILSQSTVQSNSTVQTRSTHSLLQAKYSGVEHHWLNQGFSQNTPEDQRRREFIRGLTDVGDSDSLVAESVASTYV